MSALEELLNNENQPPDNGLDLDAEGFLKKLQQLKVAFFLKFGARF